MLLCSHLKKKSRYHSLYSYDGLEIFCKAKQLNISGLYYINCNDSCEGCRCVTPSAPLTPLAQLAPVGPRVVKTESGPALSWRGEQQATSPL